MIPQSSSAPVQSGQTPVFEIVFSAGARPERHAWTPATSGGSGRWVHLDRRDPAARAWAEGPGAIEPLAVEALFEEDTRPRLAAFDTGDLLILRAVNTHPGADPEDMISIRIWIEGQRVVSVSGLAVRAVEDAIARYTGPDGASAGHTLDPGALVALLATRIAVRARDAVKEIDDTLDTVEEAVLDRSTHGGLDTLLDLRRRAIWLRRYFAPQFEALEDLAELDRTWLSDRAAHRISEAADTVLRLTEILDALRDHATVVQDQVASISTERSHRTLYILTIAAAIFLPVNLIAALMGANVGGIPGADSAAGFLVLCSLTIVIVAVELAILRWLRLI